jgi:hypothetical protein
MHLEGTLRTNSVSAPYTGNATISIPGVITLQSVNSSPVLQVT